MHRLAGLVLALALSFSIHAAIFVVDDDGDASDANTANGVCATATNVCTLRAAIEQANALAGTDTIHFDLASDELTITPATPLLVTSSMIIDGTTQLGVGAGPFILIDGQGTTAAAFDLSAGVTVTIQGLAIGGFTDAGIKSTMTGTNLTIKRCHIGVGLDGMTAMPNGDGILARVPNTSGGSLIVGDASGGGNVISGNGDMGIEIFDASASVGARIGTFTVQGNKIGLGADGMTAVPNASGGIRVDGLLGTVTIGGSVAGRNLISGNNGGGYLTQFFFQADLIDFSHNYVGIAQDGVTAHGNKGTGARLVAKKYSVASNTIAWNQGFGLSLATSNQASSVVANEITGNTSDGVRISGTGIVIGGPGADGNVIANNGGDGIAIVSSGRAEIAESSIFANGDLGIDLNADGVSANDAGDGDTGGGNNMQNYPMIASALRSGGITFVNGSLSSAASTTYTIRFYSSAAADPSGHGEGESYLGAANVTANAAGSASFTFSTPGAPVGTYITATATDPSGNTSEFSNALVVAGPPQIRMATPTVTTAESGVVTLTVERVNGSTGAASVDWMTIPGSASMADFTFASGTLFFANGETSKTIDVSITPDSLDEGLESFNVELSNPSSGTELGPAHTTIHITDDDPEPSISIADASGTESATPLAFDVTLSAPSEKTITIDYLTADGTATAGSDYAASAGTLTFAANETAKTISVAIVGDANVELDETFGIVLSNPVNVTIANGTATGTIINDDGPPSITIDDVAVVEGDSATFTVTLSAPTASTVTVDWSTSDGTAIVGDDYDAGSGTLTFAPGEITKTITVVVDEDAIVENNETFFVDLSGPANATLADAQGGGTIADDDGTPSLSINDPAVVESMNATFTVTLAPPSALPVTVTYATSGITATDPSDYAGATGTLTFVAGETSKTVDIATAGDPTAEDAEQFAMTLSSPGGAVIADATGTATIIDDDGLPRVTIGNVSAAEGSAGGTVLFTLDVDLSHASAAPVTVEFTVSDGTAVAVSGDFIDDSGTLTFVPGDTSETIGVLVAKDDLIEPNETFIVTLSNATNATITDSQGTGTIINDDGMAEVSIANVSASEGTALTFDVALNAASGDPVTVQWASADGTASAGSDYTADAGSVVFAPGDVVETITIATAADPTFEPDETLFINLIGATNATIADAQATGTILNDDSAPAVPSVSIADASVTEGDAGTATLVFAVTLDVATVNTVSVDYATGGGSAVTGADYVGASGTLTFAPGVTSQSVEVAVIGDTLVEGNETMFVTLSAPSNAILGTATGDGTIVDDDVAPAIPSISIAGASIVEGNAGSAPLTLAVTLSEPTVATITVDYATGGGTATAGADYATTAGTLTFAPGVTTQNVVVPVVGDTLVESSETFIVMLTSPSGATLGIATATGTIVDDDVAPAIPSISIAGASIVEGNAGSAPLALAVTLSVPTVATVSVDYATGGGTATAGADYATTTGTLTFAPGVTTQNLIVPVIGDTLVESSETLNVTLTSPSNGTLGIATATGTIVDDDSAPVVPSIAIGDVTHLEGDAGATLFAFPVTLSSATTLPVSVAWTTAGSATDFVAASGTIAFAPGMTSQTIHVAVHGDEEVEDDETFSVQLSAPSNATLADAAGAGTIRNDDHRLPATPSLRASGASVTEGDDGTTEVRVTLTLSSRAMDGASVRWMTRGGTATGGSDFVEASGNAIFSGTTATIAITVLGDRVHEDAETFVVELFDAVGATLLDERAEITIVDDDSETVLHGIVLAVGSAHGNAGSRFGTAVQMVNFSDEPAAGTLRFIPAGTTDAGTSIPYSLAPRELRVFDDLLPELGLGGLSTLDVIASSGPLPRMSVRIYDDGSGNGTTGFTLPVVTPDDALRAGDGGLLFPPDDPQAMRFNVGVRTLDGGAAMTIEVRDRLGATVHTVSRDFAANWFLQMSGADFAGVELRPGDYVAIRVTRGAAILYGAVVDNITNDPSVHLVVK